METVADSSDFHWQKENVERSAKLQLYFNKSTQEKKDLLKGKPREEAVMKKSIPM